MSMDGMHVATYVCMYVCRAPDQPQALSLAHPMRKSMVLRLSSLRHWSHVPPAHSDPLTSTHTHTRFFIYTLDDDGDDDDDDGGGDDNGDDDGPDDRYGRGGWRDVECVISRVGSGMGWAHWLSSCASSSLDSPSNLHSKYSTSTSRVSGMSQLEYISTTTLASILCLTANPFCCCCCCCCSGC